MANHNRLVSMIPKDIIIPKVISHLAIFLFTNVDVINKWNNNNNCRETILPSELLTFISGGDETLPWSSVGAAHIYSDS